VRHVLARWNPWEELQQLERQMATMSRRAFGAVGRGQTDQVLIPAVDMFTRNGDLVVRAEVPGIDPEKDVEVTVQDGVLVLRGERRTEGRMEAKDFFRMESSYGAFQRSIPLPQDVKEDEIKAFCENGILEVVVPGAGRAKSPKRIPVSASSGGKLKSVTTGAKRTRK